MQEEYFATEWDMCWFCDHCGKMVDWRTAGYREGSRKLCYECSQLPYEERQRLYKTNHSKEEVRMSRKDIKPQKMEDSELGGIILDYQSAKKQETNIKKMVSDLGGTIKQEMQNRDVTEFVIGDVRASITITPNQDVNELQAIEILRKALTPEQFSKVVKTKEYIDDDEFEKLVYAHEVDAEILMPAVTPKAPTVTLRLGKVKKQ